MFLQSLGRFDPDGLWGKNQPNSDFAKEFNQKLKGNLDPVSDILDTINLYIAALADSISGGMISAFNNAVTNGQGVASTDEFKEVAENVSKAEFILGGGAAKKFGKDALKVEKLNLDNGVRKTFHDHISKRI